jgi:type IV pilus assembly protein PilN
MIKINLVSSGRGISSGTRVDSGNAFASFTSGDEILKNALKRLIIILIPVIGLYVYEGQIIPQKQDEVASKNQVLGELTAYNAKQSGSVAEIKKFKEEEALIESRITALNKISKDRFKEIRVMDLIQQVIPEKAWLRKIQIGQQKLMIEGTALSDYEVSSFMEALTKSAFLMDVNLVTSSEVIVDGSSFKNFEISCLLEGPQ